MEQGAGGVECCPESGDPKCAESCAIWCQKIAKLRHLVSNLVDTGRCFFHAGGSHVNPPGDV